MNALSPLFDLAGKCILVTGASSGLGRHFAKMLAQSGARVAVAARRVERLDELVADIRRKGGEAEAIALDVTDRASVVACLEEVIRRLGGIDVVVNNAGVSDTKAALDYTDADWNAILQTNLKGAWLVAQESARAMADAGRGGSIINVTSILASRLAGGVGPYCAAKAGLSHLTRAMALELARYNIRVNALAPGYVMTEINEAFLRSDAGDRLKKRIPMRRFCQPQDLDGALVLLASDASQAMTGAELVVDNGHACSSL
ncbi:SDR family NAD(P)-dependent oxidoreductase [Hydrocarboniclastica marina]|uniref:SDR family NAD(P)-dependent oxidoreductase n=1 Tax=Hydrocarboniclastica marina TaxID=2259620 RepID=A0A4P7XJY4_9ALTE|nr:SDR family NAD(P)-dependent oxidoreductase [Hydrocarboniclastica marina]QCF27489.1 SDR family NAD(P)-dependent oxidoreductase [Hydrocarboniclastica marina]